MGELKVLKEHILEINDCRVLFQEPMAKHTSFRVGGPAEVFALPFNMTALSELLSLRKELPEIPWVTIGCGSNLLISDKGFKGVVVKIGSNLSGVTVEGTLLKALAGTSLSRAADVALEHDLSGLEFASGIPGSVGGAVFMNAGAYGDEIKQILEGVKAFNSRGEEIYLTQSDLRMAYRYSILQDRDWVVGEVDFSLNRGDRDEIKARMDDLNQRRRDKQPLDYPSAGSAFKRPPGYYAGKLIQDSGLKGYSIGGAGVSEKHAGFIINKGDATAQDIYDLIRKIQKTVLKNFGVLLEPEIKIIGKFE
ncbi:MAG: UDP-N-acetylmuramate dehydrogenase [Halanaerobium sp.]|nr:UDP-N-acetylmuramate dehydrogenase [Halanaerobium sp.]